MYMHIKEYIFGINKNHKLSNEKIISDGSVFVVSLQGGCK